MANNVRDLPKVRVHGLGGATAEARLVEERDGYCYVVPEAEYHTAVARRTPVEARLGFPQADVERG